VKIKYDEKETALCLTCTV